MRIRVKNVFYISLLLTEYSTFLKTAVNTAFQDLHLFSKTIVVKRSIPNNYDRETSSSLLQIN